MAYNQGLLSTHDGLLRGMVAHYSQLLGWPGTSWVTDKTRGAGVARFTARGVQGVQQI